MCTLATSITCVHVCIEHYNVFGSVTAPGTHTVPFQTTSDWSVATFF